MGILLTSYIIFLFVIWLILSYGGISALIKKGEEKAQKKQGKKLKILLMVPCKGTDIELERNLRNATRQDYPNYKAIAIVESKEDSAFKSIKASEIDYMVANSNCQNCSGKVRNLASAIKRFKNFDAYCIMDSDVNVRKGWLSSLAEQMDDKTGISTAYPIFNPLGGFWSKMKNVWGFVGFGLMENPKTRFGCGGSMLFRKELLKSGGFEIFSESISDDVTLTNLCKRKGFKIAYAPKADPIIDCTETAPSFMEWSNRQTAFSVLGNRRLLYIGLVYYSASVLLLISAIVLSIFYSYYLAILLLPFALFVIKTYSRSKQPDPLIIPICFVVTFVYLSNMINAVFMKQIQWRGRTYRLV